jgi:hypothetical protein
MNSMPFLMVWRRIFARFTILGSIVGESLSIPFSAREEKPTLNRCGGCFPR